MNPVAVLALLLTTASSLEECGVTRYSSGGNGLSIYGGSVAKLNEFPWQVALNVSDSNSEKTENNLNFVVHFVA